MVSLLSKTEKKSLFDILNSLQASYSAHILLYHSCYNLVPKHLKKNLHNVNSDVIFQQISWLKKYFDIITVDELFNYNGSIEGKMAITFDDGYDTVFQEALPVLNSLNAFSTIFINGVTLQGLPWRNK